MRRSAASRSGTSSATIGAGVVGAAGETSTSESIRVMLPLQAVRGSRDGWPHAYRFLLRWKVAEAQSAPRSIVWPPGHEAAGEMPSIVLAAARHFPFGVPLARRIALVVQLLPTDER